ncbi:MAG: thiamine pyrophosphate-dependent enzyme, partial [Myxococcales bacterium]|nr:thiamine pyrophosphate-dependent enzyme [Myxococcales bacterium]
SGASSALLQLAERSDLPIASTLLGLGGVPASHPLFLGMMGMHGEAWVNTAIQEADLLIALGMRFDDRVTGKVETCGQNAKKIHVELDPAEINKVVKVELPIVADVREVLSFLAPRIEEKDRPGWLGHIGELRSESRGRDIQLEPEGERLRAAHAIADIGRLVGPEAILVSDVGQHQMWEAQYCKHERPRSLLTSGGLGTMGFALPAAIGARFARPEGPVWVIAGDGGFQMTACELSTAAQEQLDVKIAIVNNGFLGMVRQWQELFFERRYVATPIGSPDFVMLAAAHGIPGRRVERREALEDAVREAERTPGPFLLELRVEPEDAVYPMVPSGADLHEMIRRPASVTPKNGKG